MIDPWTAFCIVGLLLICSGFFSGSETAVTAVSMSKLHHLMQSDHYAAGLIHRLKKQKDKFISAILIGNNLVNTLATSIATGVLTQMVGESGIVWATIIMTVFISVFSEVLPKTLAIHNPYQFSFALARPLSMVVGFLSPFALVMNKIIQGMMWSFGYQSTGYKTGTLAAQMAHEEELRGAIDLHNSNDPEIQQERVMLKSILDLADVDVSAVMKHRKDVFMVDGALSSDELLQKILESPYTRIPIYIGKSEDIIGVLHAKDVLKSFNELYRRQNIHVKNNPASAGVQTAVEMDVTSIASPPWFIPETTNLLDQLQEFRRRREHFAIVVDEYGSVMGIVTLEDILEEIVGDISDEHDQINKQGIHRQKDGSYIIDGAMPIRDLKRELEWRLPEDHATTLAGLVIHEAEQIPTVGQVFTFFGFRFEILKREKNQIIQIKVYPPLD